jgi:hypothetical protein
LDEGVKIGQSRGNKKFSGASKNFWEFFSLKMIMCENFFSSHEISYFLFKANKNWKLYQRSTQKIGAKNGEEKRSVQRIKTKEWRSSFFAVSVEEETGLLQISDKQIFRNNSSRKSDVGWSSSWIDCEGCCFFKLSQKLTPRVCSTNPFTPKKALD